MQYHYCLLKQGNYTLKGVFQCPFCRNQYSSLTDLRKHGDELSRDTSVTDKYGATKHSALKRYIDVDLSYNDIMDLIEKKIDIDDKLESDVKADNAELFVYPWMAIVVNNVSIYDLESKHSVRKNDEQIKEEMLRLLGKKEDELRLKVTPLWDKKGKHFLTRILSINYIF
jgi:transcription elongation factor Elf1